MPRTSSRRRKRQVNVALFISLAGIVLYMMMFGDFKFESQGIFKKEKPLVFQMELDPRDKIEKPKLDKLPKSFRKEYDVVPRGQSFFYTSSESRRLGSFEIWRPRQNVGSNLKRISGDMYDEVHDNVFLAMHTSTSTLWKNVPIQLLTTFQSFRSFGLYADFADSIGGVEVVDVLEPMSPNVEGVPDFEPYRILKSIRDSHVSIDSDIVSIPGIQKLTRFQMLPMLHKVYSENPQHDWYLIVDDKTTLLSQNLRNFLKTLDSEKAFYLGKATKGAEYVFASLGSGIVLSKGTMRRVFHNSQSIMKQRKKDIYEEFQEFAAQESRGDYILSKFLKIRYDIDLNIDASESLFQEDSLGNIKMSAQNWCKPLLTIGNQRARDVELAADYLQLKDFNTIMYSDIYLDFVKPYLTASSQTNWDNGAQDIEFGHQFGSSSNAHNSLTDCRNACKEIQQCLMFRYDAYTEYCGLGISSVALGGPVIRYQDTKPNSETCEEYNIQCSPRQSDQPMTSEWFIDRIRSMRESLHCDPLHEDPGGEGIEYGALDQVEGWWHRAMQNSR